MVLRWLVLLGVGCGGESIDDSDSGPDPRLDPTTWPSGLGTADRPARVVAPTDFQGSELLPVIVLLHGYSANAMFQDLYLGLSPQVDEAGFVLVLPEGTEDEEGAQFWNATDACCDFDDTGVDDVGHVLSLLDEVERSFPVDPDRISLVGHSNGGYMAYRMACDAGDRIASIAGLAGATWLDEHRCGDGPPVHVLHTHGTLDDSVPYEGSARAPGAVQSIARWAARAGCDGSANPQTPRDYDLDLDGAETDVVDYPGCARSVELWTIEGAGHVPSINAAYRTDLVRWLLDHPRP